jgi:hypothetical protein
MFDQSDLHRLEPPDHLRQLPEDAVAGVVAIIISELPHMPYGLGLELRAFAESRTIHDARRLANALRHCEGRPGLAKEVEDILPEETRQ